MRRLSLITLALAAAWFPAGCRRTQPPKVEIIDEEMPKFATMVHVADPKAAPQLVRGFYALEQGSWRWTAPKFAVTLRPPRTAAERGATLQLKFSLAEPVLAHTKTMTLRASIGGTALAPETYSTPGDYIFTRDVPASLMTGDSVTIDFSVDKWLPATASDHRDLALIVSTIGFELK